MTQFAFIAILSSLSVFEAFASSSYEDAQAELGAAYNRYYGLLKKKKSFTQQDAQKLAEEILAPSIARVAKAMEEEAVQAKRSASENNQKTDQEVSTQVQPKGRLPAVAEESAAMAIDGSNTPKEIEFPAKSKAAPKP